MASINVERIISVSSEDPAFPAANLLKPDNKKTWKCKVGEKQASVILQLKQDTSIEGIDIGNDNSAFVEVLVGRSSSQSSEFKVLLLTSSLMTLKESKDGTNTNGVRFFKKADLTKPTGNEKWDRVKIVCTQPFNKHVQYGLSFIVMHSSSQQREDEGESSNLLGNFSLKQVEDEQPAVGTWFAKRKEPPPAVPPGAAAAIRDASTPNGIAQGKLKKPTPKRPKVSTPKNGAIKPTEIEKPKKNAKPDPVKVKQQTPVFNMTIADDEDSPADDTDADSTYSPTKDSASILSDDDAIPDVSDEKISSDEETSKIKKKRPNRSKKDGSVNNGRTPKRKMDDIGAASKAKAAKIDIETKPFGRLLEGVTIVISGYQNPLRGELRSKACSMGARYKADWDPSCTHLICAFVNTPKFNQVRGRGKIVKKEWVEECHNRRRRLPWRRFALDKRDDCDSSEEEIWEEGSIPTSSSVNTTSVIASGVNRRRVSSGSDTEEEIERVRARQTANQTTKKALAPAPTVQVTADAFTADTDVDSDTECQTAQLPLPHLPDLFENIVFHIASDILGEERKEIQRYITAYKGCVADEVDGCVEYVITRLSDTAAEVGEEYGISAVDPKWIWDCSDSHKFIPVDDYVL